MKMTLPLAARLLPSSRRLTYQLSTTRTPEDFGISEVKKALSWPLAP
jgi:hypothetical protein